MTEEWDDFDEFDFEEEERRREQEELSPEGIAEANCYNAFKQRRFRQAADAIAEAYAPFDQVAAVALIGSCALPLRKEIPRHDPYRRERIELWYQCGDLDLAVWLTRPEDLNALRKAKNKALATLQGPGMGVSNMETDVFLFETGTDRYLGRLCEFNACPKGKRDCRVPGCGDVAFLKQHDGFRLYRKTLAKGNVLRLFERENGVIVKAGDLPVIGIGDDGEEVELDTGE